MRKQKKYNNDQSKKKELKMENSHLMNELKESQDKLDRMTKSRNQIQEQFTNLKKKFVRIKAEKTEIEKETLQILSR
jgi:predicted nuclease with TOPRIM domain